MPNNYSYEKATLIESVAVVLNAVKKLALEPAQSLCICGCDFNGLVLIMLAKEAGLEEITVVEGKKYNQNLAREFGAKRVIDPGEDLLTSKLLESSDFMGYDKIAVTSSNPTWIDKALDLAGPGAKIVFTTYYDYSLDSKVNSVKLFRMGMEITNSILYTEEILYPRLVLKF